MGKCRNVARIMRLANRRRRRYWIVEESPRRRRSRGGMGNSMTRLLRQLTAPAPARGGPRVAALPEPGLSDVAAAGNNQDGVGPPLEHLSGGPALEQLIVNVGSIPAHGLDGAIRRQAESHPRGKTVAKDEQHLQRCETIANFDVICYFICNIV